MEEKERLEQMGDAKRRMKKLVSAVVPNLFCQRLWECAILTKPSWNPVAVVRSTF